MAVTENRGGYRPTAPQNNPANINARGGNGQSGMNNDYTGFAYGQNKAVNEQRQAAPMAGESTATRARPSINNAIPGDVISIDAPSQRPDEPVTFGGARGEGPGEEILGLPAASPFQPLDSGSLAVRAMYMLDPNNQDLKRMLDYIDNGGATR